ncbi:uncharacterized protein LOC119098517 [Pollicipes pollicipes]|uniref:uncharacterized protein LOC119098517 n=1 Tax=Pollicipes pollicipes TaxID=41117 RepID=UPI001885959A|nr:uncharacterized protein LOC119098517 [Pollicipes pollicipes]
METEECPAGSGDAVTSVGCPVKRTLQLVERQVEALMRDARRVQQERDALLETLLILQNEESLQSLSPRDRETANATCESLVAQCLNVDINIDVGREPDQEVALHMVNNWIDQLILTARHNPAEARVTCETYVRTLKGDGRLDESFHSIVTNCSAFDQETVGARLGGLLKYIDHMMSLPSELE